jgi:hypothetical protein
MKLQNKSTTEQSYKGMANEKLRGLPVDFRMLSPNTERVKRSGKSTYHLGITDETGTKEAACDRRSEQRTG